MSIGIAMRISKTRCAIEEIKALPASERIQMGKNGREKAQRIFGWDTIAERYETVFESVITPKAVV